MKLRSLVFMIFAVTLLAAACGKSDADIQKAVAAKLAADRAWRGLPIRWGAMRQARRGGHAPARRVRRRRVDPAPL